MEDEQSTLIKEILQFPETLKQTIQPLSATELDSHIREGAWTIRQIVHHLADSHVNSYVRIKLMLTEAEPPLKPYDEAEWAKLADSKLPVEHSLLILENIHIRLASILQNIDQSEWSKSGIHGEHGKVNLRQYVGMVVNHGQSHYNAIVNSINSR